MSRLVRFTMLSVLLILAVALVACGGQAQEATPTTEAAVEEVAPTAVPAVEEVAPTAEPVVEEAPTEEAMDMTFAYAPDGALAEAVTGAFSGTTVTVDGAFEGNDADGVKFAESVAAFTEATGITVNYIGNKEFEGSIAIRVDAGDKPDIVDFPQPGLFANFVRSGDVVPVDFISDEWLSQQYNPGWREFNTIDGAEYGVMHRYSGKSLVWYPKAQFEAAGYEIPETWDELMALTQTIADDGDTAWCIGIESGAATGWPATDWTEDMMLRTTSLENYDAWVAGELPFSSPEVQNAIETWSELWFNDDYVSGGRASIVSTFFGDSPAGMFSDPPQCWLHRQANFITSFFPEGTVYGEDYDFFYLPPVDEAYGRPFLVAGDLMAMMNDRPEVRALMEYFTTPQSVSGWLEGGGAIAAHQSATREMYGSDLDYGVSELVNAATSFRFDGSDLMPGEVGAGSFWEQITSYVAGSIDLETATAEIDASWPTGVAGVTGGTEAEPEMIGEMAEAGFAYLPETELAEAIGGAFSGTTVTVDGAFEGNDADGVKFAESVAAFEEATGIDVNYIGNKEFEGSIAIRVDAGDKPDIVDFPQPGLFANFVRSGDVVAVTDFISDEWLTQQYNPGWREFNTIDGAEYGVMHRYSGKSLVWYPKAQFEAAGYEIPETWDELMALTQTIADDGDTAWCIGIESGAATGWPATDWTEDMMLRTTSLENYDAWVAGELPFSSPEVQNAIETWSELWFNDDYVSGGRASIVSTFFGDSPAGMFSDPPQCWLHRQANFITSFFPEGTVYGEDYDFFYLPPVDEAYGRPFLVAGDLMAMMNDRPEVRALMQYFTTPQSVSGWLEGGGAIAAHQTATREMYGSDLDYGVSELVNAATSFRFDGSDLMPGEVGAGSFWEQITSYVAGSIDLATATEAIDATWP